jgi:cell fate regulator YaaT (PSP1 superfamily)
MYTTEQLTKTFEEIVSFHKIEVELVKIEPISSEHYLFYIKEIKEKVDPKILQKELGKSLRITAEVRFMKAREKAQSIGGCGPCGRELCCASWLKNIPNVSSECLKGKEFSDASEFQGMCGKLRCCLAYLGEDFKLPDQPIDKTLPTEPSKPSKDRKREDLAQPKQKSRKKKKFVRILSLKPKKKKR